jgi:hypothetical protein
MPAKALGASAALVLQGSLLLIEPGEVGALLVLACGDPTPAVGLAVASVLPGGPPNHGS